MSSPPRACPGCGLRLRDAPGPVPSLFGASSGCWRRYGELLARSYSDPDRAGVHQLVVDSYVAQHPAGGTRQAAQQVALCLMTLELFLERGHDVAQGPALHKRMMKNLPPLEALDPPDTVTGLTVEDVLAAADGADYRRVVREWAQQVWDAWAVHHGTVRRWNDQALG